MIYVLDTHAIVWYLATDPRLSPAAEAVLDNLTAEFVIPTIVLVEIQHLHAKKKFQPGLADVQQLIAARNCTIHPLNKKVVTQIPVGLDIHDSIIVATALVYRNLRQLPVTLITKDSKITNSGLIQTLW
jgi:PIN domain nuclease of toxin-antitoxin system